MVGPFLLYKASKFVNRICETWLSTAADADRLPWHRFVHLSSKLKLRVASVCHQMQLQARSVHAAMGWAGKEALPRALA